MDIAEVAKRSGMAASTLRYYEKKGLIASTGRQGLRRTFGKDVLPRAAQRFGVHGADEPCADHRHATRRRMRHEMSS